MAAFSQVQGLEDARAMHRYSHRARITGDINSNARMPRGIPRNSHHQKQMRAPTPTPRADAAASGKFNSVTTLLRNSKVCSRLQRPVTGRLGFAKLAMGEPIEFPRLSSVAATLRSSARVLVFAENNEAQGSARPGAEGTGDGGGWGGGGENSKTESMREQESRGTNRIYVERSTVESTRAKKAALVEGKLRFRFLKREGRT